MAYRKTGAFGGTGGVAFSDDLTQACRLAKVIIRHGARVDSIACVWTSTEGSPIQGTKHGGDGGSESSFELAKEEYINRIEGRSGEGVDSLTFFTNVGNKYGPYGGSGGEPFEITDLHIGGFYGRSGARLDEMGGFTVYNCE